MMKSLIREAKKQSCKYLIGIDEVGRGPLAGPVTFGAVCVPMNFDFKLLRGAKDSKQLSYKKRQEWLCVARQLRADTDLRYCITSTNNRYIDQHGLAKAIKKTIRELVHKFDLDPTEVFLCLDGGLRSPAGYDHSRTIIKGDDKVSIISLASIVCKEHRDAYMRRMATRYPGYGFESNVGYGTQQHRDAIAKIGPCELHRKSWLK